MNWWLEGIHADELLLKFVHKKIFSKDEYYDSFETELRIIL